MTLLFSGQQGNLKAGKMVGGWSVSSEHLMVTVYEAPTIEAFQKFRMEPECAKWIHAQDTSEVKIVQTFEESMKALKEAK
jgi:hypothetical protein